MIVLPNYFERYLFSLRNYVALSILKNGLKPRYIENLKKIYSAEALFYSATLQSVNINKLCTNLLKSVKAINPRFDFSCTGEGVFFLNKKLFCALLVQIAKNHNKIILNVTNRFITIRFTKNNFNAAPFLSALNGYRLQELTRKNVLLVIPAEKSTEKSVYIESEWEYIFDNFSVVNLFLSPTKHQPVKF